MKRIFLLIFLFSLILFGHTNSAVAADPVAVPLTPVVTSLDPVFSVDIVAGAVNTALDPCSGAALRLPLANCSSFDPEVGEEWYRKVMSCDIQLEGVSVGRVISEYLRLTTNEDAADTIWVQIRDQMVFEDALTIWGNSYNDTYNHWGAEGMSVNILDAAFNYRDTKIKYTYSNFGNEYNLCLWIVGQ